MTYGDISTIQTRPDELMALLSSEFVRRAEPNFAWKSCVSTLLALPLLRGAWPMSSVGYQAADQAIDVSGQGNHLTANSDIAFTFRYDNLIPTARIASVNNEWLSRADGAGWADITGGETYTSSTFRGLTLGGWFNFSDAAGSVETLMAKWDSAANERSYLLVRGAAGTITFFVSDDGINTDSVVSTDAPTGWFFVAGRFDPSTELKIWINSATDTNVAGIYALLHSGAANFTIGRYSNALNYLNGWASLCFLCAGMLSDSIINQIYHQTRSMFGV